MIGDLRRAKILNLLSTSTKPIPARKFADDYKVSRQVIVGDIALLRAEGHPIMATNKGYLIKEEVEGLIKKYIAVNHKKEETRLELETFIKHNVLVESVTVEHPAYGEITGQLNIKSQEDVDDFLALNPELLSTLTDGVHIHTILCHSDLDYINLKEDLNKLNILYEND